jgi:hypothetical protein
MMEKHESMQDELSLLRREVNALLGLLSFSAARGYPETIHELLHALMQRKSAEIETFGEARHSAEAPSSMVDGMLSGIPTLHRERVKADVPFAARH